MWPRELLVERLKIMSATPGAVSRVDGVTTLVVECEDARVAERAEARVRTAALIMDKRVAVAKGQGHHLTVTLEDHIGQ